MACAPGKPPAVIDHLDEPSFGDFHRETGGEFLLKVQSKLISEVYTFWKIFSPSKHVLNHFEHDK